MEPSQIDGDPPLDGADTDRPAKVGRAITVGLYDRPSRLGRRWSRRAGTRTPHTPSPGSASPSLWRSISMLTRMTLGGFRPGSQSSERRSGSSFGSFSLGSEDDGSSAVPHEVSIWSAESMPRTLTGVNQQAMRTLKFTDPSLLRGCSISAVLHRGAAVLGKKECTAEHYGLSERVDHVEAFVSHNWSTPRSGKFVALCMHFNLRRAWLISTLSVLLPFAAETAGWLAPGASGDRTTFATSDVWGCQLVGTLAFFAALFCWHEVSPSRSPFVFLDKTCVCQTDIELKRKGISNIAAFLAHSASMVVLYSDTYLQKLWTVYEIASFMLLFPRGRLFVQPIYLCKLIVFGTACVSCMHFMNHIPLEFIERADVEGQVCDLWHEPRGETCESRLTLAIDLVVTLPLTVCISLIFSRWARQQIEIWTSLQSFHIHNAQCQCEDDRRIVESNIAVFAVHFGFVSPGTRKAEVLELFDALVHQMLPELLRTSLGRAGVPYSFATMFFITFYFQIWDLAAISLRFHGFSFFVLMHIATNTVLVFCMGPIAIAILSAVPRLILQAVKSRCLASVVIVGLAFVTHVVLHLLLFAVTDSVERVEHSLGWMCFHLLSVTFLMVVTFLIYQPAAVEHEAQRLSSADMDAAPMPREEDELSEGGESGSCQSDAAGAAAYAQVGSGGSESGDSSSGSEEASSESEEPGFCCEEAAAQRTSWLPRVFR